MGGVCDAWLQAAAGDGCPWPGLTAIAVEIAGRSTPSPVDHDRSSEGALAARQHQAAGAYAKLPLSFIGNKGQTDARTVGSGTTAAITITATYDGITRTATATVSAAAPPPPPPPPAQTVTLTVAASGRSGERITWTPTGVSVTVGSSGTASFPIGTSITLSVSNGRELRRLPTQRSTPTCNDRRGATASPRFWPHSRAIPRVVRRWEMSPWSSPVVAVPSRSNIRIRVPSAA